MSSSIIMKISGSGGILGLHRERLFWVQRHLLSRTSTVAEYPEFMRICPKYSRVMVSRRDFQKGYAVASLHQ